MPIPCDVSHYPDWPALLQRAAAIVNSYDTLVTLRQRFYRLVAAEDPIAAREAADLARDPSSKEES